MDCSKISPCHDARKGGKELKPYRFVSISKEVEREKIRDRHVLDKDLNHGKWIIKLTTLTPIMVLSGHLTYYDNIFQRAMVLNSKGLPVIPGSSIKGIIRSTYEALTKSCIEPPIIKDKKKKDKKEPINLSKYLPQTNNRLCFDIDVCPACQLFGYVSKKHVAKSLISFSQFIATEKENVIRTERVPKLYLPLPDEKALKWYLCDDDVLQRKFYTHGKPQKEDGIPTMVVSENVEFVGEMTYENVTDKELAILLTAFGQGDKPFAQRLGYAKPAFYGSVQFTIEEIIPYESPFFKAKEIKPEDLIKIAQNLDDPFFQSQKERLADILNYEANKHNEWLRNAYGKKGY